jgi:hypothetical protein
MMLFNASFFNRRPRMATAFNQALARVQQDRFDCPDLLPDRINQLAREQHHTFRQTILTPGNTLRLFVQQVAFGNIACSAVRHLAGQDFSDSAWCQARSRLPLELIRQIHRQLIDSTRQELFALDDIGNSAYRWRTHRLYVVDGTSDSMPDAPPLREHYGVPAGCGPELGFPMSHLLVLLDHRSGLLIDCIDSPRTTSDVSQTPSMHQHLQAGDILLADDAFAGWGHLALILQANLHAIMPVHHKRIVKFGSDRPAARPDKGKSSKRACKTSSRVIKPLGFQDQLVEYLKLGPKPAWMNDKQWEQLPQSITLREIRRTVQRKGFRPITVTIVTTLLDPQPYPAEELIELRLSRWMVETNIRHLKITLGMDILKCKSVEMIRKERLVFLLVYNLIRLLMLKMAKRQRANVNRLSFADALAWLRFGDLQCPVDLKVNSLREGRLEPRVLKRPPKQFSHMTLPRAQLKAQLRARYGDTT